MNHRRKSIQLRVAASSSERTRTPADSDRRPNNSPHGCGASAPTRKARSGPGRRQVHSPTTSLPGPSPHPTDLSGRRCPPRRTSVPRCWGETSPLSPQAPLYPLLCSGGETGNTNAQNGLVPDTQVAHESSPENAKTGQTRSPGPRPIQALTEAKKYEQPERRIETIRTKRIMRTIRSAHPFTCWY
jgi:hypothetical protein